MIQQRRKFAGERTCGENKAGLPRMNAHRQNRARGLVGPQTIALHKGSQHAAHAATYLSAQAVNASRLSPRLPNAWMPVQVRNGHNGCNLSVYHEKHSKWKSMKNRPAKTAEDEREA
jgi:hypothetical protein